MGGTFVMAGAGVSVAGGGTGEGVAVSGMGWKEVVGVCEANGVGGEVGNPVTVGVQAEDAMAIMSRKVKSDNLDKINSFFGTERALYYQRKKWFIRLKQFLIYRLI